MAPATLAHDPLFEEALRLGDSCLVLAQRLTAWCGKAPILEEDIAVANVALDLIGQAQMWLGLAGEIEGLGRSADDLAYKRDAHQFRNFLLVERPNGDFGQTLMRQYLFDAWHFPMLQALKGSSDPRVAAIAEKGSKEVAYHLQRSRDLVIRLGDGSDESHARMQAALDALYPYTGEMTTPDAVEDALASSGVGADLASVAGAYEAEIARTMEEATLALPKPGYMHEGGKTGVHTEHLGYLLAEMQFLQRAYPGAIW